MKRILNNLFSLSIAEIITKILGVITTAYLARIISPDGYGILGFSAAIVSFFALIVVFGFDTYGTREIAKISDKPESIVNNILSVRIVLAAILYGILCIYVIFLNKDFETKTVILASGISLFAQAVSLNWYFQGKENIMPIAIRQILTAMLTLLGVIVFVRGGSSVCISALVPALSGLLNSFFLLIAYSAGNGKIRFELNKTAIYKILSDVWPIGLSFILISIYYNLDMIMMGYMRSEVETGIYSAAYKIFLIFLIPLQLILNVYFPSLSRIGLVNTKEFHILMRKFASLMISSGIFFSLLLFILAKPVVLAVFGPEYASSAKPLAILSMNIMIIALNMFWGNPLIAWGLQKYYIIAVLMGAVTNILLNFWLIPLYSYAGASLATLFSEVAVFIGILFLSNWASLSRVQNKL